MNSKWAAEIYKHSLRISHCSSSVNDFDMRNHSLKKIITCRECGKKLPKKDQQIIKLQMDSIDNVQA